MMSAPNPKSSLPLPFLEQVGDGILKAGQGVFAFEQAAGANEPTSSGRVTDLNALFLRVNHPGDTGAAGEEISEPLIDSSTRVVLRENLHGQIRCAREKLLFIRFEAERCQ